MIRSLRQRHRRMFAVISVLVPVAFAVGVAARKPVPAVTSLPGGLVESGIAFQVTAWEREDLFEKSPVRVRLLRQSKDSIRLAVEFDAVGEFTKPDLMVYWIAGNPKPADKLPDHSLLLGAFGAPAPLALPGEVVVSTGSLVLFSLADQEIVEISRPFKFVNAEP